MFQNLEAHMSSLTKIEPAVWLYQQRPAADDNKLTVPFLVLAPHFKVTELVKMTELVEVIAATIEAHTTSQLIEKRASLTNARLL